MVAVGLYDECETLEQEWADSSNGDLMPDQQVLDSSGMHETLGQWFSEEQLALIECAFEGAPEWTADGISQEDMEHAANFRHREEYSAEQTLKDIFQNVIDNDGTFMP
jgi:hypothetical protein